MIEIKANFYNPGRVYEDLDELLNELKNKKNKFKYYN